MKSINDREKEWLLEEKYNNISSDEYLAECALIDAGMPVAYLIGYSDFLDCHIDLSHHPLIPRAETEYWTDIFIKKNKNQKNLKILDIFSGSGCIGIAVQKHLDAQVDFADINKNNIEQIKKNLKINNENDDSSVYRSDVFDNLPQKKYDFILANPPYIAHNRKSQVQNSVLENENVQALFAENNGLFFVYRLIDEAAVYLESNGELWIEFDSWQTNLIDEYLEDKSQWTHDYINDQYGEARVLVLKNK